MRWTSHLNKAVLAGLFAVGVVGVAASPRTAAAQQATGQQAPEAERSELVTGSGTVEKLDKSSRMVTIKTQDGRLVELQAGPNVNLNAIKQGDAVTASYYQEAALSISNPGETAPSATQTTERRNGVAMRQTTVTATIVSVNPDQNTVVLRGPQGNTHMLRVQDPNLQSRLRTVRPGQNVTVTYTQALATAIQPASGGQRQ